MISRSMFARSLAALAIAASILSLPAMASAGTWHKFTNGGQVNFYELDLYRSGSTLHGAFRADDPATLKQGLYHRTIDGTKPSTTIDTVVSGWNGVTAPAILGQDDGTLQILYGGLKTSTTGDPHTSGKLISATSSSAAGTLWTVNDTPVSTDTKAYASMEISALRSAGTTWASWSGTSLLQLQKGTGTAGVTETNLSTGCCQYLTNLAADASTGAVWLGYYSNQTGSTGQWVQNVSTAGATPILLPGTFVDGGGVSPNARMAIASRDGGMPGVFAAWAQGYPITKTVKFARFDAGTTVANPIHVANTRSAAAVGIAPGYGGRMWIFWMNTPGTYTDSTSRLFYTRTNAAGTAVGAITKIKAPKGTTSVWRLMGDGAGGASAGAPFDFFAHVTTGSGTGTIDTWHTQLRAALSLSGKAKGMKATFVVTEAGTPIKGAKVKFKGKTAKTNAAGKATIKFASALPRGRFAALATHGSYEPGATTVKVS